MADVRDFGAVGDGVADDTDALRHAVAEGDGRLLLPPGVYKLTGTIEIPLGRRGPAAVSGSGGVARLVMRAAGPALRLVGTHDKTADPKDFRPEVWASERMPTVGGLEIVGEHDRAVGIELDGTMQATVAGVLVRRCRYGIHLTRRNRNVLITHCHLYDGRPGGIGVYFDGVNLHQTNIVGCHISYWPHAGIKVERSEVRNLQITGNDIEYNFDVDAPDSADVWVDATLNTVREVTIASNTIQAKPSPGGANVRIDGPDLDDSRGAGLWTIAGNILQSQETNLLLRRCRAVAVTGNSFASGFGRSARLDRCRAVTLAGNTFDRNPDYTGEVRDGLEIAGSAGVVVTGGVFEGIRAGPAGDGAAISVRDSSEITIAACQILDPAPVALSLANVRNTRVTGCTIVDRRRPPGMVEAVRWAGPGGGNALTGNLIGGGTRGRIVADTTAVVEGDNATPLSP